MFSTYITRWPFGLLGIFLTLALIACATTPFGQTQATSTPTATPTLTPTPTSNVPTRSTARLTYNGHAKAVISVVWSPDGKRLASGSDDGTVQV